MQAPAFRTPIAAIVCALLVAGCAPTPSASRAPGGGDAAAFANEIVTRRPSPRAGECWHREMLPAVFETVTEQVLERPARIDPETGATREPARFSTVTQQRVLRDRREVWFRVPCTDDGAGSPGFNATLQRALKARGLYDAPVTGEMDAATREAVRRWQAARGLNSDVVSLAAARALGIVAADFGQR